MKTNPFFMTVLRASLVMGLVSMCACAPASYSRTDIVPVAVGGQLSGSISSVNATVPVSGVIVARIAPFNSDGNPMVGQVVSDDPSTVTVLPALGDKNYAILGVRIGSTTLRLLADDEVVATIPADVVAQP